MTENGDFIKLSEQSGNFMKQPGEFAENWKDLTWAQILCAGKEFLQQAGIAEFDLDAWYLFSAAFHMDKARYYLDAGRTAEAEDAQLRQYWAMLERRAGRVPLQHILGTQEFMGLTFTVSEHVLIPRQDTETLVETVLTENPKKECSILDMCTGSGCIAVSLAALGGYGKVEGADISEPALAVARENARRILEGSSGGESEKKLFHEPGSRESDETVKFRRSDLFSEFGPEDRYNLIVSNPPYIPTAAIEKLEPEVRDFEPRNALDGTEDGLYFYRRLAEESPTFLKEGGKVYFEIGYDQGQAVSELLSANGFTEIRVIKDLAGKDRVVCARKAGAADCRCMKQEV